ncbi:MAG: glycosyltransferase [Bacteroidales bacterium]|jgi:glycosyltransferase involved in cell wall biosynthesis|nr:glycosyltransferase [Bacteroidales bacterium]
MIKVIHIGQLVGGLDIYIRNVIEYSSNEFEYIVVHGKKDNSKPLVKHSKFIKEYQISLYRELNPLKDIFSIIQALKIVIKEKPDVIHCHSAKGGVIGRIVGFLTNAKTLYTPHAFSFLATENHLKRKIYITLERVLKFNSFLLACSESEKELGKTVVKYKQSKALVWQNSVPDTSFVLFKKNDLELGKYVCYIGRPSFQKNTFFLIDVVRKVITQIPDFRIYLLGVGYHSPDLDKLTYLIQEYSLSNHIILIPWIEQKEAFQYLSQSEFYISVSRYEGLPLSILEAMALSKPIVASNVSGNKDCVGNEENGYLLPLDINLFSEKIQELWNDHEKRDMLSKNSRIRYLNEFNIEKQIVLLQNIYLN